MPAKTRAAVQRAAQQVAKSMRQTRSTAKTNRVDVGQIFEKAVHRAFHDGNFNRAIARRKPTITQNVKKEDASEATNHQKGKISITREVSKEAKLANKLEPAQEKKPVMILINNDEARLEKLKVLCSGNNITSDTDSHTDAESGDLLDESSHEEVNESANEPAQEETYEASDELIDKLADGSVGEKADEDTDEEVAVAIQVDDEAERIIDEQSISIPKQFALVIDKGTNSAFEPLFIATLTQPHNCADTCTKQILDEITNCAGIPRVNPDTIDLTGLPDSSYTSFEVPDLDFDDSMDSDDGVCFQSIVEADWEGAVMEMIEYMDVDGSYWTAPPT